ncbi:MAG: binding domain protein, excisionase family protein [Parcubacteria group bacterium GW2011_GWF2_43_11]|nr:MAG: binding domain protein, excisionase family protein [Parcubacteria group bacterium GW2011_GWF2_43_11]
MKTVKNSQFVSTAELAKLLGISRIAVFKKIKNGEIKATKVGRAFIIDKKDIPEIAGNALSEENKRGIEESVVKTIKEYGETLRLLGEE